jgi:phage tail tape-measure protein
LTVTDFLDEKRQQIAGRLKELESLVEEHRRLKAAVAALAKLGASAPAGATTTTTTTVAASPRRRPGRPRGSAKRASKTAPAASPAATAAAAPVKAAPKKVASRKVRRGRRKGSGTRAAQALAAVRGQPGVTIPELAPKIGVQATYLYRVLPGLEREGKVEKKGRGWFPREG